MENIPKKIYLQIGKDADVTIDNSITDFNELFSSAITWCTDKVEDNDIKYVRLEEMSERDKANEIIPLVSDLLIAFAEHIQKAGNDGSCLTYEQEIQEFKAIYGR